VIYYSIKVNTIDTLPRRSGYKRFPLAAILVQGSVEGCACDRIRLMVKICICYLPVAIRLIDDLGASLIVYEHIGVTAGTIRMVIVNEGLEN